MVIYTGMLHIVHDHGPPVIPYLLSFQMSQGNKLPPLKNIRLTTSSISPQDASTESGLRGADRHRMTTMLSLIALILPSPSPSL